VTSNWQEFKHKANNSSEARLHAQIAEMAQVAHMWAEGDFLNLCGAHLLQQRVGLEREKDGAMQQKRQYKEQLVNPQLLLQCIQLRVTR
jgi:hypothetical protein